MFEKILLATDGSGHAFRAAQKAAAIALKEKDASIEVVYVVNSDMTKADVLHHWDSVDLDSVRKEKLAKTTSYFEKQNVSFNLRIIHGEPGPNICKIANDEEFDLVVIGSRGLNTLQEMVLGSVSHKVAKRANCPVMIVK